MASGAKASKSSGFPWYLLEQPDEQMISVSIRVLESMLDDLSNGEASTNAGKGVYSSRLLLARYSVIGRGSKCVCL